jgi:hypothetical protein
METNSFETAFSIVNQGDFLTSATLSMADSARIVGLTPLLTQGTLWDFPAGVCYRRSTSTPIIVSEFINKLRNEINNVLPD